MSFWMKIYHKNMQLMLVLLKAVFLLLHFFLLLIDYLDDIILNVSVYY